MRERRGYEVLDRVVEELIPSCEVGPGCEYAHPDSPCCGRAFWREVERTTLRVTPLDSNTGTELDS